MVSVLTSGHVNTETILHFFYKITNERGTKTVFTYTHVKWFYGQSERAYYWPRNKMSVLNVDETILAWIVSLAVSARGHHEVSPR